MSYSLHPEAEKELASAASFCQSQAGSAPARAFLSEFERVASPFRRFPYSVVYRARSEGISILVVAHQHRRPEYWRGRR